MRSNRLYRLRNHNRFTPPSQGLIRNIERLNSCVMRCNYRKTPPLNQRVKFKITISSVGRSFDEGVINDRLKANYPIPEHSLCVCACVSSDFSSKIWKRSDHRRLSKKRKKRKKKKESILLVHRRDRLDFFDLSITQCIVSSLEFFSKGI